MVPQGRRSHLPFMNLFSKLFGNRNPDGETPEYRALVDGSLERLRIQTQAHQDAWGLGSGGSWDFSQDTGDLVFECPDKHVRTRAQIIGTYNSEKKTWLWSWANPSIEDSLKQDALKVQDYGQKHGVKRLITPKWEGSESDAWEMTALAARLSGAGGAYRGPAGTTFVFFTFGDIEITKAGTLI